MRIAVLLIILSLVLVSPTYAAITPLSWAENTADCLTDQFGKMGRLARPAWVEERGVRQVEVHLPERRAVEGLLPAATFTDTITTERVVLDWITDGGDEVTTWFDLIWRETGPEPVEPQAEAEGLSRYYRARQTRWLVVEGQVGGDTPPLVVGAGANCTERGLAAAWRD